MPETYSIYLDQKDYSRIARVFMVKKYFEDIEVYYFLKKFFRKRKD